MQNNFIQKKHSLNSKLLILLTNRQKAKSTDHFVRNDWPGKLNPNFTSTIRIQTASQTKSKRFQRRSMGNFKIKYQTQIPHIRLPSQGQLTLKPCSSNPFLAKRQYSSSEKNSRASVSSTKSNIIQIHQNQSATMMSRIFKNSKITKKVNQIVDKKLSQQKQPQQICLTKKNQEKTLKQIDQQRNLPNSNSLRYPKKLEKLAQNKVKTEQQFQNGNQKNSLKGKYKIDFITFGYIQKVMDNPELWSKYVHKVK